MKAAAKQEEGYRCLPVLVPPGPSTRAPYCCHKEQACWFVDQVFVLTDEGTAWSAAPAWVLVGTAPFADRRAVCMCVHPVPCTGLPACLPLLLQRKPYNESVDVFSMGVMLYELFSRTLLIYTHTPANKPDDCEHYAARISDGYRPKRVRAMTDEVWELIEACWHQDPSARPAARDVLLRLQRLLAQAQAADAAKGPKGFGKLFGRASQEQAAAAAPVASGGTAGQGSTALQAASADPAAQSLAGMPPQKVGVEIAGGPGREAHARAEPACGCVIC